MLLYFIFFVLYLKFRCSSTALCLNNSLFISAHSLRCVGPEWGVFIQLVPFVFLQLDQRVFPAQWFAEYSSGNPTNAEFRHVDITLAKSSYPREQIDAVTTNDFLRITSIYMVEAPYLGRRCQPREINVQLQEWSKYSKCHHRVSMNLMQSNHSYTVAQEWVMGGQILSGSNYYATKQAKSFSQFVKRCALGSFFIC